MSANWRRGSRTTKPLALIAGLGLASAGLALPAHADEEPDLEQPAAQSQTEPDDGEAGIVEDGTEPAETDEESDGEAGESDGEPAAGEGEGEDGDETGGDDAEEGADRGAAGEPEGSDVETEGSGEIAPMDVEVQQAPIDLRILSFNDFHGRIGSGADEVGDDAVAVGMACFVDAQSADNPNTLLVSAGDNIGGTTFTSFIDQDFPTLDVMLELGVDVSAFGNHEFDQGRTDVDERVVPYTSGGDGFSWIGANIIDNATGEPAYDASHTVVIGADDDFEGITVSFIGALTEDMPNLVTPAGIESLSFTSMSEAVNAEAERLADEEDPDVVVVLVHDGFGGSALGGADSAYGQLVHNAHESIDAIISGHTHQRYMHEVDGMWVTQAGQYGAAMGVLDLSIDPETGDIINSTASIEEIEPAGAGECEAVSQDMMNLVDQARAHAEVEGGVVVGSAEHDFNRARNADGSENRGGESVLGALVADAHLWAAQQLDPSAQIAFMNPGGLRADLAAGDITFRAAANVQPFANTLFSMELTGAQIAQVLEEQWSDERDFLKLGHSSGFRYIYDPEAAPGERILEMFLDGEPVEDGAYYTVVANSFIASGGDGFSTFTEGRNSGTTGQIDLESTVSYVQEHSPLAPDFSQRAVGLTWVSDPEAVYAPGDEIAVDVSSFAFTAGEPVAEVLHTYLGETPTGEFALDADPVDATDEAGRAEIRVTVPHSIMLDEFSFGGLGSMQAPGGPNGEPVEYPLQIVDETTGTLLQLPVLIGDAQPVEPPEEDVPPVDSGPAPEDLPATGASVGWVLVSAAMLVTVGLLLMAGRRQLTAR